MRILIVDDEEGVRRFARGILTRASHDVEEAPDAAAAIVRVEQGLTFDLLVSDLEMPEMGGAEMVRRIRQLRDGFKVLYVTGFIDSLMDSRPLMADEAFLEKPYSAKGLLEAVNLLVYGRIVLDNRPE